MALSFVDGSNQLLEYDTGKQFINELISDDWGAPPRFLSIDASTSDGVKVRITIPYSSSTEAHVIIDSPLAE